MILFLINICCIPAFTINAKDSLHSHTLSMVQEFDIVRVFEAVTKTNLLWPEV